ncbi:hypothetical protein [Burkholderia pseudomallei]|uniref:hypothetical protein n=1 Tax=Burkholderia pseudomallei TaxID=28450 RepID=UPI0005CB2056|nr:hypothetical protein [Burkholderia pseudomallei]KIX38576.1 fumarate hydratase [Burkholderia pseudomallei]
MRSATSGAIAAGASIDTWRGDCFSSGRRCERACSMWDGGGRFVGVAGVIGVIGVIGAAGRGEPAGGEARGPFASRGESTVVILRSTPFGKNE